MDYRSRAVRSLVELHEREMESFFTVWDRFVAAGAPMPEALGDESYASRDHLLAHVVRAMRNYLVRIGEWVGRPVTDVDMTDDVADLAARARPLAKAYLEAYPRHLASVTTEELEAQKHKTRWGDLYSVEMLLEHAVVHPMRHRIQLERQIEEAQKR